MMGDLGTNLLRGHVFVLRRRMTGSTPRRFHSDVVAGLQVPHVSSAGDGKDSLAFGIVPASTWTLGALA